MFFFIIESARKKFFKGGFAAVWGESIPPPQLGVNYSVNILAQRGDSLRVLP